TLPPTARTLSFQNLAEFEKNQMQHGSNNRSRGLGPGGISDLVAFKERHYRRPPTPQRRAGTPSRREALEQIQAGGSSSDDDSSSSGAGGGGSKSKSRGGRGGKKREAGAGR
ncbi:unnamed protein product, partial [Heterosigma akashiwo]